MCAAAATAGRLDVLRWLRENGCPWSSDTARRAALGGHLDALRWAVINGCPWEPQDVVLLAEGKGHYAMAAWCREHARAEAPPEHSQE